MNEDMKNLILSMVPDLDTIKKKDWKKIWTEAYLTGCQHMENMEQMMRKVNADPV